jgi:hypothetical protein
MVTRRDAEQDVDEQQKVVVSGVAPLRHHAQDGFKVEETTLMNIRNCVIFERIHDCLFSV